MEYVYANNVDPFSTGDSEFVILPRETAEELAEINEALGCETWGELRATATPELLAEIYGYAGYGEFEDYAATLLIGRPIPGVLGEALASFDPSAELPPDEAPFDAHEIGAVADGDYPPHHRYLMNLHIPADIIRDHGRSYETIFNGTYATFSPEAADAVIAAMRELGHSCDDDFGLISDATSR